MSTVVDLRTFRGVVIVTLDDDADLRIRKKSFEALPLQPGDQVDAGEYIQRMAARQSAECYEAALSLLDVSARSASALSRRLMERGYVPPAVEAAVERLRENRLLDDAQLAQRLVENSLSRPIGRYALRQKLRARGISESDAEAALEAIQPEQQKAAAIQAAEKYRRKYRDLPRREARAKLSQALARKGFDWETIDSVLSELESSDE